MMFILQVYNWHWCEKYCVAHFNAIDELTSTYVMFPAEVITFQSTSLFSLSFSMIVGLIIGCFLTLLWNKSDWHKSHKLRTPQVNAPDKTNQLIASQIIYSAVKDLICSQYVVKDRKNFKSLLQTPLRTSIAQLRLVADSLVESSETIAPINAWPTQSISPPSLKYKHKLLQCDVLHTINEQIKCMDTTQFCVQIKHQRTTIDPPILPICPAWFSGVVRELLVNAVKHNQQDKVVKIAVQTSVQDNSFILCVSDDGVGLSSKITEKLDAIKISGYSDLYGSILISEEPTNLANIKRMLFPLNGTLEVISARQFLTKIVVKIPLTAPIEPTNLHTENCVNQTKPSANPNIPVVLLISQHHTAQIGPLHFLAKRFNLICADSIEQSCELIKLNKPECVLFDTDLGKLNALFLQRWLARSIEFDDLPMVTLENQTKVEGQLRALQSGISAVIDKSANAEDIIFVIEKVINEKQRVIEQVSEGIANYHSSQTVAENINDQEDKKFITSFALVLRDNFKNEGFNRPEAAKLMLMTEKTLARRLHQHYKLGFTEKLRQFKLHQAKILLVSGINVTTAAYECGFSSPSYFAKCFRAEFGIAPSILSKTQ